MLTVLYGFHLIVERIFLSVTLYWHFVDIVWILLFLAIYIGGQREYYVIKDWEDISFYTSN